MIKHIALGLIFLACGGTGVFLARGFGARVRQLELCMQMLAAMRAQLQFSRPPLERMLGEICAGECPAFLPSCLTRMQTGIAFPVAWREALEADNRALREEDRRPLLALGEILGAGDAAGQCETLGLHESLLQTRLEQARARRDSRGKACFTLGLLAGLTVIILFF